MQITVEFWTVGGVIHQHRLEDRERGWRCHSPRCVTGDFYRLCINLYSYIIVALVSVVKMALPDNKKFFENLSGGGKAIAVLTSGGDAQGRLRDY